MGALANAAILMKDPTFLDWCMAAAAYQARLVILEDPETPDHAARKSLALSVVSSPEAFRTRFTTYIATDPSVASKGSTPELITEATVLEKVETLWTTVSTLNFTV